VDRPARVLVVEDAEPILASVATALTGVGHEVLARADGARLEDDLAAFAPDVVVLDVMLPGRDGYALLPAVRATSAGVILLTARTGVADRVRGLRAGADDYLVKPFDLDELAARIRALLRRKSGRTEPEIEHLGVALNPATHRVTRDGRELGLSPKEFSLLQLLMERPGNILSRAQIEERLYGWGEEVESNAVEVHIHSLRRKLGNDFILNVRGVGYRVRPAQ
jgi:DNA-binding response OmpR family regulator